MHATLNRNLFFVREHVGMFKASNNFDILDPESGQVILECREPGLGAITKILRFTEMKRNTPFDIEIRTPSGELAVRVKRGWVFLRSKIQVSDGADQPLGHFQQRLFSIGGKFILHDTQDRELCTLQGKWTGWDFRFTSDDAELARVTKKWTGLGRELFTTADNYILEISDNVPTGSPLRALIMATVMCIDMVLKE